MNNEIFRKNSIDLTDLSMIVNDSFNNTNNDNIIQISKPINFNLLNRFNNELLQLGYDSIVNYEKVADLNALFKNGEITYTSDINEFSDWTSDEFMSFINKGLVTSNNTNTSFNLRFFQNETSINTSARIYARIAASVDWRTKGVVNAIKNQGRCGSCWAFSANDILESYSAMITGVVPTLSEQNLVDCTYNYDGCQGGWMTDAFDYVIKNKGIGFGYGYPYSSGISGTVNIFC
jgi:C1A family cysteine protease